ncbi:MAG: hypothetical protein VW378_03280 [bacterium]
MGNATTTTVHEIINVVGGIRNICANNSDARTLFRIDPLKEILDRHATDSNPSSQKTIVDQLREDLFEDKTA